MDANLLCEKALGLGNGWKVVKSEMNVPERRLEAVNGVLQKAKRMACGFRNFHYFRLAAYLKAGHLNIAEPLFSPT